MVSPAASRAARARVGHPWQRRREQLAAAVPRADETTAETWPSICAATIDTRRRRDLHGGGGGGLGDPLLRDPAAVVADLQEERISPEAAQHVYGVVVGDDGAPDDRATRVARMDIRRARLGAAGVDGAPTDISAVRRPNPFR